MRPMTLQGRSFQADNGMCTIALRSNQLPVCEEQQKGQFGQSEVRDQNNGSQSTAHAGSCSSDCIPNILEASGDFVQKSNMTQATIKEKTLARSGSIDL